MSAPYREFVLDGPRGWTVGFLQGFARGRDPGAFVVDAESEGCEVSTVRERLRELVIRDTEIAHVLVRAEAVELVREAVEASGRLGRDLGIRLERGIESSEFAFSFECFSRDCATRIRGYFDDLPDGVKHSADTTFDERVDPSAKGVEPYAPAHDYEFTGHGTVLGGVAGVLAVHRRFADDELIDAGAVRLHEG